MLTHTTRSDADADTVSDDAENLGEQRRAREHARNRIVRLARSLLPTTERITDAFVRDLSLEARVSPASFRTIFPTNDDLLRGVNDQIIRECLDRLGAIFLSDRDGPVDMESAARSLASAWPLDWAGVTIRAKERAAALIDRELAPSVLAAEKEYAPAVLGVLTDLLARIGKQFTWPPLLAARVMLLTYERSFEAWLLSGAGERDFPNSPYIRETLPLLLEAFTAPIARPCCERCG